MALKRIANKLTDQGRYIGSDPSFCRVLKKNQVLSHHHASRSAITWLPRTNSATDPCQVWGSSAGFRVLVSAVVLSTLAMVLGCDGMRFIYSTSRDSRGKPSDFGMAYQEIWFASRDGLQLNAWLVPGEADKPLIFFCHGNAANISHRIENIKVFNRMGFSVFIFDYRGFGRSQGEPETENDLYQDARSGLDFLTDKGWLSEKIIIYGRSMGAAVALQLGIEVSSAAVVMECPFTSLAEIARHLRPITYALIGWWGIGARFDNLEKIGKLNVPIMILQGDRDIITPPQMAVRLFEKAKEPKTFHLFAGGNHSDLYKVGREHYERAWMNFLTGNRIISRANTD